MPLLARGEVSGFRFLGPFSPGVRLVSLLRSTYERCRGESTDLTYSSVVTDEEPTVGWKLLEQGPKSQATSENCSVGPSSLIDASDLDALSVVSGHALRQSALTLIAFLTQTIRCWSRFA